MRDMFLKMYPDKHLTTIQVMTALKEHKILYNTNMRSSGNVRGCYYGVHTKLDIDEEEEQKALEMGVDKSDQSVNQDEYWKQQFAELQAKYNNLLP